MIAFSLCPLTVVCHESNDEIMLTVRVTLRNVLNTACVLQTSLCDDTVACTVDDTEEHEGCPADHVKQHRI